MFDAADLIFSYTREQAIDDGALVDVSETAKEAGFRFPVALTSRLNALLCLEESSESCESYDGRLWDVLFLLRIAARRGGEAIEYTARIGSVWPGR